jgi:putative membrane protein
MKPPGKIRITLYLLFFSGAALFTGLLVQEGASQVGRAFATAGWGIMAVVAYHLVPLFLDAVSWWVLLRSSDRLPLFRFFWMRWIGESVSTLVPSAVVGGDIVRARIAAIEGVPLPMAAGSVLVDITLGIFTQAAFTLFGLALLVDVTSERGFVAPTLLGTVAGVLAVAGFYFVQRMGMFRFLARIIVRLARSPEWQSLVQSGEVLDQAVRTLYGRWRRVVLCCGATVASLVGGSGEIWIALHVLGLHATVVHALILQSTVLTIRSVAFPVPGALGVQEGGYLFVGGLLGIPGDAAFALSLLGRVRELTLGVPGLVCWQWFEGRRLWQARAHAAR